MNNLSKKVLELHDISEMAFDRSTFVDNLRDKFLGGALGEYAKLKISEELGLGDFWSNEIKRLLSNVKNYMSDKVKTKKGFSKSAKKNALKEALREASLSQFQITNAKNDLIHKKIYADYHIHWKKINKMDISSKTLIKEMVHEYLPEYFSIVSDIEEFFLD